MTPELTDQYIYIVFIWQLHSLVSMLSCLVPIEKNKTMSMLSLYVLIAVSLCSQLKVELCVLLPCQ